VPQSASIRAPATGVQSAPVEDDEQPTRIEAPPVDLARDAPLGPGTEVHGYVIDGELGKGGMGFVYSATHPLIGKRAAIKILKPEVSTSPIILERFIQEARAVNQIQHPNIVDIFAFGTLADGRAYHVMDLLVGETLRKRLRRGALHPSEAAAIIDQTASALNAAHDKGFVHRDLKPDNIFLVAHDDRWPEVKLLDFGLAKLMPEAGLAPFTTKVGVMLGTPEYMSPEQARGVGVDYRTDIYALGVLTFEILAGRRPFPSRGDAFATLQAHAEEPPPSLRDLVSGLPAELVQLVDAMLAKEPGARPSLAAIRTVIKRLRTTLPSRTAAVEIAALQPAPASIPPAHSLELRTSAVGAEPVVPSQPAPARFSQMQTPPQPAPIVRMPDAHPPGARHPSQPPIARGPSTNPPLARHPSQPPYSSNPGIPPALSTHGGGTGRTTSPNLPALGAAGMLSMPPSAAPTPSTPGVAASKSPLAGTRLGVAPPPRPAPAPTVAAAPAPPQRSYRWLVIALVIIAAGIALVLALA